VRTRRQSVGFSFFDPISGEHFQRYLENINEQF